MNALLLLAAALCPQDDSITRTYDLRTIVSGSAGEGDITWLQLPLFSISELYPESPDPFEEADGEVDLDSLTIAVSIVDAIEEAPGARVDEYEQGEGWLRLTGDRSAHEICTKLVGALEAHMHSRILVEAFRVDRLALAGVPGAVLSANDAAALAARAQGAPRHLGWARWGRVHDISESSVAQYLQDYDVEVAQFQASLDPTVNYIDLGLRLAVRVDRSAHGPDLIARIWGRNSAMQGRTRLRELPSYAGAVVEHPYVDTSLFLASGVVEPGGALVVDAGDPDGRLLVVRFLADVEPRSADDPTVDLGELCVPPHRGTAPWLPVVVPSRGLDPSDEEFDLLVAPWTFDRPTADDVLQRISGNRPPTPRIELGSSTLVALPPGDPASLREEVRRLAAVEPTPTIEFTFALTEVAPAALAQAVSNRDALEDLCDGASVKRSGSTFSLDTLMLMGGTVTTHISDHDVQISQGAEAGDPIVKQVFDGSSLWCSPVRATDDAITAWIDVRHQEGFADARIMKTFITSAAMVPLAAKEFTDDLDQLTLEIPLELAKTRPMHGRTLARLVPGRWEIVAAQPFDGDDVVQLIAVKGRVVKR